MSLISYKMYLMKHYFTIINSILRIMLYIIYFFILVTTSTTYIISLR